MRWSLDSTEIQLDRLSAREKEAVEKLHQEGWFGGEGQTYRNVYMDPDASGIVIDSTSELADIQTKLIDFRLRAYSKLILSETAEAFNANWETLKADYALLQPEKVINYYNDTYQGKKQK